MAHLPEWPDMQGLVLSSYPKLPHAVYALYTIHDQAGARRWLSDIAGRVTSADKDVEQRRFDSEHGAYMNVAVTHAGLTELCRPNVPDRCSLPFVEGIAGRAHRSRILGDSGSNRPEAWEWGGTRRPVHLLWMVFAASDNALQTTIASHEPASSVMAVVARLNGLPVKPGDNREHFGFVDGISQPLLTGTPDAERYPESRHVTALGEVVLGYPDACRKIDPGPALPDWPGFGKNGTYLVFRQIEQDVSAFWRFMNEQTAEAGRMNPRAAECLASKVVGRSPSGAPLVPYVNPDDNEFTFAGDPHGYGCPIGAHIRRANPRGSLASTPSSALSENRHRILRRGRPYGTRMENPCFGIPDDVDRGLLFIGLNSDFERQFEFIHQNWVNNAAFAGLAFERDPLVGDLRDARPGGTLCVPGLPARIRIEGFLPFITVRGAEYFFLPGMAALKTLGGAPPPRPTETS